MIKYETEDFIELLKDPIIKMKYDNIALIRTVRERDRELEEFRLKAVNDVEPVSG